MPTLSSLLRLVGAYLGVIPLLIATRAGGESQKVVGASVFAGMIAATFLSLAIVPML